MNVSPELDARFRAAALRGGPRRRPLRRRRLAGRRPVARRDRPRALPHLVHGRGPGRVARARLRRPRPAHAARRRAPRARRVLRRAAAATFDLPLDLRVAPFHEAVLRELARVPYGQVDTYGHLAAKVGRPKAARAVGTVMNRNPIPIVLPCHRIVGANGSLTGYAGGLDIKRRAARARGRDARRSELSERRRGESRRFGERDPREPGPERDARHAEALELVEPRILRIGEHVDRPVDAAGERRRSPRTARGSGRRNPRRLRDRRSRARPPPRPHPRAR